MQRVRHGGETLATPFFLVSILECVYLEVMAALHALYVFNSIMPAMKRLHMSMIRPVTTLIRDSLLSSPGTQSPLLQ